MVRLFWEKEMKMSSCCHKIILSNASPISVHFEYFGDVSVSGQAAQDSLDNCEKQYKEKLEKIQEEYDEKLKIISDKIDKAIGNWFDDMQGQIPGFLLKLLNLIIPKVQITEENLTELVAPLLEKTSDDKSIILHFSEEDQPLIENIKSKFQDKRITWTVDTSLKPGDVLLETSSGTLDNRLQSRIKSLKERWMHHSV